MMLFSIALVFSLFHSCMLAKLKSIILQVRVCREKSTGHVYAMKKLKKSEMLRRGQVVINYNDK